MLLWLEANLGTIVVSIVLIAIVSLILVKSIKDRKSGKSSCGCDCASCGGICHQMKQQ